MAKYRAYTNDLSSEAVGELISLSGARLVELPDGLPHLRIEPRVGNGLQIENESINAFGHTGIQASKISIKLAVGGGLSFNGNGELLASGLGAGDVSGPASATDNALARFDTTTGKLIQNSLAILGDDGTLTLRPAATQDAVILAGRAGGTGSFGVTITPTTLTASRTLTLADGNTTLVAGTMFPTSGGTITGNVTMSGATPTLTAGDNFSIKDSADSNRSRFTYSTSNSYDTRTGGSHIFQIAGTTALTVSGTTLGHTGTVSNLAQSTTTAVANLGSGTGSGGSGFYVRSAAGQYAELVLQSGTSTRWNLLKGNEAETGSNAGSPFKLAAYTDAGAFIDTVLTITRAANGSIAFASGRPITGGTYNSQTISSAASLTGTLAVAGVTTLSADLTTGAASNRIRKFTMLQSGYIEQTPVNFRFDQDVLRYVNRWGTATITAPNFTATDLDNVFSQYASFLNLNGKADGSVIEVTGVSLNNSANSHWYPYVLMHSNTPVTITVVLEVLTAGSASWQTLATATITNSTPYYIAEVSSIGGVLQGARWTFSGQGANNVYIRSLGVIGRNSEAYAWNLLRSGGTVYGNVAIGYGGTLSVAGLATFSGTGVTAGNATQLGSGRLKLGVGSGSVWPVIQRDSTTGGLAIITSDGTTETTRMLVGPTSVDIGNVTGLTQPSNGLRVQGDIRAGGTIYANDFILTGGSGSGTGLSLDSLDDVITTGANTPTDQQVLTFDVAAGNKWIPKTVSAGTAVTIADDTSTNGNRYLSFVASTSGTASTLNVSSTKLTFNPSTGVLTTSGGVNTPTITRSTVAQDSTGTLTTSTTTANQVVMTLSATTYRSAKFHVQATSGSAYQVTEILVVHDGTTCYLTEYGTITTGASLATFNVDISGGNIRLLVTPTNAVTTIKADTTAITV